MCKVNYKTGKQDCNQDGRHDFWNIKNGKWFLTWHLHLNSGLDRNPICRQQSSSYTVHFLWRLPASSLLSWKCKNTSKGKCWFLADTRWCAPMALETISHMTQNGRNGHRRTRFFLTKSSGNKNIGNNILQKQKNLNKYLCHTNVEHCLTLSIVWPLLEDQQPMSLHKLVLWIIVPTGKSFLMSY